MMSLHDDGTMGNPTYSTIISPDRYNRLMFAHRYIAESDAAITALLNRLSKKRKLRVLEIGCGPARLLPSLASVPDVTLTGLDHDSHFLQYATTRLQKLRLEHISLVAADVMMYAPEHRYDVVVSQGVHHHIEKAMSVYILQRVTSMLQPDGVYILSDEFLPTYTTEQERRYNVVIWYCHIIASALHDNEDELAREECKTMLDDLQVTRKSDAQIATILHEAPLLNATAMHSPQAAAACAAKLLTTLAEQCDGEAREATMVLSRGDYKIDHEHFLDEIHRAGLAVDTFVRIGPLQNIGAMHIYTLRKVRV